jgi:hypothetical protein
VASDMIYALMGCRGMRYDSTHKDDGTTASTGKNFKEEGLQEQTYKTASLCKDWNILQGYFIVVCS